MAQTANINDYITVPDCAATGILKQIKPGGRDAIGPNSILIYEIETSQGMMLFRLIGSQG